MSPRFCYRWWPAMAVVYLVCAFLQFVGAREELRRIKLWLVGG
jgi:hypothetical protein